MNKLPNLNPGDRIFRDYGFNDESTLSRKISDALSEIARRERKKFNVENEGGTIEIYHYGNDSVRIIKRLHDATVGEDGGKIRYYAEWSEYARFDWWKSVLDKFPIYFLELPIENFASEGNLLSKFSFSPEKIVENYNLNPEHNLDRQIACIQWVEDQVVKTLNPKLAPEYKVIFLEGHFRLIPLTQEAKESRLINNGAYDRAKAVILSAIEPLRKVYEAMSKIIEKK